MREKLQVASIPFITLIGLIPIGERVPLNRSN